MKSIAHADYELGIGINSDPSPNVAPSDFLLFRANVFRLCANICPYFVTLKPSHPHITHVLIMEFRTRLAKINKQFGNGVSGNPRHPRRGPNAVSFDQGRYNPNALVIVQRVHNEHNA